MSSLPNVFKELATDSLPEAAQSNELELMHIRYSFIAGVAIFVLFYPAYSSRKSFYDAVAARKVVRFLRFYVLLEMVLIIILFSFYFHYGAPVRLHAQLSYGNGASWLYSFGRPAAGLLFIGIGLMGDTHPIPRIMCMIGCGVEIFGDAISAYQVRDYYRQVKYQGAPSFGYSENALLTYYWRDIISLGVCTTALMLVGLLTVLVGCSPPQLIHPSLIAGKDLDRYEVMRNLREKRRLMELQGILGPPPVLKKRAANQLVAKIPTPPATSTNDPPAGEKCDGAVTVV